MLEPARSTAADPDARKARIQRIVIAYPFGVAAVSALLNLFLLDVRPLSAGVPASSTLQALAIAGIAMAVAHSWLMTATEITRTRYSLYATPEEWKNAGLDPRDASEEGVRELQRAHNAHRNVTENTVIFALLAVAFVLASPSSVAAWTWLVGFAVARLGYTWSYLTGRDDARALFMTLTLLATYGVGTYLFLAIVEAAALRPG